MPWMMADRVHGTTRIKDMIHSYVFFRAIPRRPGFTYEDEPIIELKREDVEEGETSLFITELLSARTMKQSGSKRRAL